MLHGCHAGRRILVIRVAEMIVHLAFQGALDRHLGELAQQPALPGPRGQLPRHLFVSRRQRLTVAGARPSSTRESR